LGEVLEGKVVNKITGVPCGATSARTKDLGLEKGMVEKVQR
jgi:hypothetical protein